MSPRPSFIFSGQVSRSVLDRMATPALSGAGNGGKSKVENSRFALPGFAKSMACSFH